MQKFLTMLREGEEKSKFRATLRELKNVGRNNVHLVVEQPSMSIQNYNHTTKFRS